MENHIFIKSNTAIFINKNCGVLNPLSSSFCFHQRLETKIFTSLIFRKFAARLALASRHRHSHRLLWIIASLGQVFAPLLLPLILSSLHLGSTLRFALRKIRYAFHCSCGFRHFVPAILRRYYCVRNLFVFVFTKPILLLTPAYAVFRLCNQRLLRSLRIASFATAVS